MAEAAPKIAVAMNDGRTVEFGAKQKLIKSSNVDAEGKNFSVTFDFANGESRTFAPSKELLFKFASHGVEQKLGDSIAGESDIADAIASFDDLLDRLNAGEWNIKRAAGQFAGTSILIKALVEASGKSVEQIKDWIKPKSQAEKLALRRADGVKQIVERLESEKAANSKTAIDTTSLLGELSAIA